MIRYPLVEVKDALQKYLTAIISGRGEPTSPRGLQRELEESIGILERYGLNDKAQLLKEYEEYLEPRPDRVIQDEYQVYSLAMRAYLAARDALNDPRIKQEIKDLVDKSNGR